MAIVIDPKSQAWRHAYALCMSQLQAITTAMVTKGRSPKPDILYSHFLDVYQAIFASIIESRSFRQWLRAYVALLGSQERDLKLEPFGRRSGDD